MAYFASGSGGGGTSKVTPKVVDYITKFTGTNQTTWSTGKTFSLSAGDILVFAVRHAKTLTVPSGFTQVDTRAVTASSFTLSILKHVASSDETITPSISQESSGNIAGICVQIRNATSFEKYDSDAGGGGVAVATIDTPDRAFIFFLANSVNYGQELNETNSGVARIMFVKANGSNTTNVSMGFPAMAEHPLTQMVTVAYGNSGNYAYFAYALDN